MTAMSRRQFLSTGAALGAVWMAGPLAGYHLTGPAIGSLAVRGNGYEFTPLAA